MTARTEPIQAGQILTGPQFNESMRVLTVGSAGAGFRSLGLVGQQTRRFRQVTLSADDIARLTITDPAPSFDGDGHLLRLGLQAHALGIAHEFDPYFGLSISHVDPLPHQLEAVYEHLLKAPAVRFLLADDAGAGKTIMAGLLLRELKLRGLIERILVVCPANLSFQWQRELREKFGEKFLVFKGSDIRSQFGVNQWMEQDQVITSLDLAKRDDVLPGLRQVNWDLVIVDEAHRMSARDESHESQRYRLGEMLRDLTDHMLLLTATPHKGGPEELHALPAAPGPGRLRRRDIDSQGHGGTARPLLRAPHQGGDGLLSRTPGRRHLVGQADLHEADTPDREVLDRRCRNGSLQEGHPFREAAVPARGRSRG